MTYTPYTLCLRKIPKMSRINQRTLELDISGLTRSQFIKKNDPLKLINSAKAAEIIKDGTVLRDSLTPDQNLLYVYNPDIGIYQVYNRTRILIGV